MTTLPVLTRTIDNAFVTTWYEIRPEAVDNILDATVLWAALKSAGCMDTQEGSDFITRTVTYDYQEAVEIERGDTLPQGEKELETMGIWRWRTIASHVQRNLFDDQKNRGKSKIKDFVGMKLKSARDGLEQKFETSLTNTHDTTEAEKTMQGLNDIVPPVATRTTGTYGGIDRPTAYAAQANGVVVPSAGNTWWGPKYFPGALASIEDDLISDMKKLYNSCENNQSSPNLIVTDQSTFELYEEFALDLAQVIKDNGNQLVDLGFSVLRFKGKPMIWASGITANHVLFLNTDWIELVYDPGFWFDMTDWKPIPLQPDRIAHIVCFANCFTTQPRRHGRLYYA